MVSVRTAVDRNTFTLTKMMQQTWTSETACDRCSKPAVGHCPECEENLCGECADWIQSGADLICRACKDEADLPEDTYIPYHQYVYMFGEVLMVDAVNAKDKLSQSQWRTLSLVQQEAILAEWENGERITNAWERLSEAYRKIRTREKEG
jgi:hypothetical protein